MRCYMRDSQGGLGLLYFGHSLAIFFTVWPDLLVSYSIYMHTPCQVSIMPCRT